MSDTLDRAMVLFLSRTELVGYRRQRAKLSGDVELK